MRANRASRSLFDRLSAHCASPWSLVIAGLWGLAEATLFFIVPDVYLGLVALFNWRRGLLAAAATVLGALVGGAIMYALAAQYPVQLVSLLAHVPLINGGLVSSVGEQMRAAGLNAMVTGPLQGIPYKVYAMQAGTQGQPLVPFLLLTIPARLERILPVALAGSFGGIVLRKFIQRHTALVVATYAALWLGVYALYYWQFR